MRRFLSLLLLALICAAAFAAPTVIWVEGEKPTRQQIIPNGGMMNTNPAELSGGAWVASWSHPGEANGVVEYDLTIPADGTFHLWLRADADTGLAVRYDAGTWTPITSKGVDRQFVAVDGWGWWPSPVFWFDLGEKPYTAGAHTLSFQLGGGDITKDRYAAIDCFCLTDGPFMPNKLYKPGEIAPANQTFCPGRTWNFTPADDTLDPASQLDLRYLNEKVAGEHGFIRLSKDGNSLLRGDGKPIRFWAAVVDGSGGEDLAILKRDAQALAKRGVNLVRIFAHIDPKVAGAKITDVDEGQLDGIFKSVAAFKAAGIYCSISPFWGFKTQASWNINPGGDQGSELLYIDKTVQAGYRAWMQALLTRPNPYTGIKLADDPTAMLIEIQNEESILSWSLSGISGPDLQMLRIQYADFLKTKYGSLEKARAAWQNYEPVGHEMFIHPEWDKGLPPWLHVWDFTHDGLVKKSPWPGFLACSGDQLEFVAGIERDFNAEITKYLKTELGCKALVNTSNWKPADMATMQDTENWANAAGDVLAFHDYFGGYHNGVQAGWRFNVGDYYSDLSATKAPLQMPTNHKQADGHPYMMTEMSWTMPDLYQSEGPLMVAGQCSVTGMGACFWSTTGFHGWDSGGSYKWSWNTPELLGQFPAAALIYRTNLLREGAPVVVEHRSLADLWARKTPLLCEGSGYDPNHPTDDSSSLVKTNVNPLALLVGPVRVVYDGHPEKSKITDLSKNIDLANKTVRSITGEIETNYGVGLYKVNAPAAQGVAGFLKDAGPQQLADVAINCNNAYATIVAVALDGKPLRTSQRVLIQVGTSCRPTGWTVRPTAVHATPAFELLSYGNPPAQVENVDGVVSITNAELLKATLLDVNGMPTVTAVDVKRDGKTLTITLPANTMYLVLTP